MAIAKGTAKILSFKKETAWGVAASGTGAKQLRRVTADFNLVKEAYSSNELKTSRMQSDLRHGVRSAAGSLNGELSPNSYFEFMQSLVARDFAVIAPVASLAFAIAGPTNGLYTLTRSTGSWLGAGFQVGQVVRITAATGANADSLNKNLLIAAMSALVLTVSVVNGTVLTAAPTVTAATVAPVGKSTFVPQTGHSDDSYTVEEYYQDIAQSSVYTGVKVGSMNIALPATGLTTVDFSFMGKDLAVKGTSQYFTSPTAQGTNGLLAAVSGVMLVNGAPVALVTSADFSVERAMENATAVGSNSIAEVFTGRITATGSLSIYFQDAAFRDYFDNETPVSLVMVLSADNTATSQFLGFTLQKIKLSEFNLADAELGIMATAGFTALENDITTGGLLNTVITIQDSTLV